MISIKGTTPMEDILDEAKRLTSSDRQNAYGPPNQDFARTAGMWSAFLQHPVTPQDVACMMIMLKCSRQTHQQKRDNWVDMAGYARCGQICDEADTLGDEADMLERVVQW